MGKLKRLVTLDDNLISIEDPLNEEEVKQREIDYLLLSPNQFSKKYRSLLFKPIKIYYKNKLFEINLNHCTEPYCKWFGLPQKRFENIKNKPSRYKLNSLKNKSGDKYLKCNDDPVSPAVGNLTLNCEVKTISNWSIAHEIKRLFTIQEVKVMKEENQYDFHRKNCISELSTPFKQQSLFYKRGKSSSNSQKWQCKSCKKITNVLPSQRESFTYHQKRNDILLLFAQLLLNRTPVKRSCEILNIASKTYYTKLEWLYKRCLEFLERHEKELLSTLNFDILWLNTDKMSYYLNNVRKKGHGGIRFDNTEDKHQQTHVVVTTDIHSRYVFASDVAYDWSVTLEQLEDDTLLYKDDHLDNFSRIHARLRFQYAPQQPSPYDTESFLQYQTELTEFEKRKNYIDGLHVNSSYTTFAQLWLLKNRLNVKEWRMVSDNNSSIYNSFFRVFSKEIRLGEAHHFITMVDKSKDLPTAFRECQEGKKELSAWALSNGVVDRSISYIAYLKLKKEFEKHRFYKEVKIDNKVFRKKIVNPIIHPLPSVDQGWYQVDCLTDLSAYEPYQIAKMIIQVNDKSTNAFIQQIRRRLNILERPLVGARGDGKSYIYANFNPKYAQYALTILRTFYNFCLPYKSSDKKKLTPAQRLGLTDKVFTLKDIINFM
ncbi:insertion element protein [Paenibacillus sp. BAC0078]